MRKIDLDKAIEEVLDVTKKLVGQASDDFILDLSSYFDDFVSHVLYVSADDARENRFISYNRNVYATVFDPKTGLIQYVLIFNEDLIDEDEEVIDEVFGNPGVLARGINSFNAAFVELEPEGFWILQNGEIHFRYKYPNDGIPIIKENYEERGGEEASINLN